MNVVMIAIVTIVMTDATIVMIDARIMIIAVHRVMHGQVAMIDQALINQIARIAQIVLMYNVQIAHQDVIRGGMTAVLEAPTLAIVRVGDLMMTRVNKLLQ